MIENVLTGSVQDEVAHTLTESRVLKNTRHPFLTVSTSHTPNTNGFNSDICAYSNIQTSVRVHVTCTYTNTHTHTHTHTHSILILYITMSLEANYEEDNK